MNKPNGQAKFLFSKKHHFVFFYVFDVAEMWYCILLITLVGKKNSSMTFNWDFPPQVTELIQYSTSC